MKEFNNDSLLAAAIWSPFDCRDIFNMDEDSSDDDKNNDCPWPPHDSSISEEQCTIERAQYDTFFDTLIEIGCDMHQINDNHQTLIHFAVMSDHEPILRRLLDAGLDPNISDDTGTLPIHLVRSVAVFDVLLRAANGSNYAVMAQRNEIGETPLGCVARYACNADTTSDSTFSHRRDQIMDLLDRMVAVSDVPSSLTNAENGTTPLHCKNIDAALTNWLLSNMVDINAAKTTRHENGQTALHYHMKFQNMDVLEIMLATPNLNWHAVSDNGLSYISLLVNLNEEQFARILPIVQSRQTDVDRLFMEQCNSKNCYVPVLHTAMRSDTNDYCLRRLLEHKDRLCLDDIVGAGIRDAVALKMAIELCTGLPSQPCTSNLTCALAYPECKSLKPCAESVRTLIRAGINVNGRCLRVDLKHVPNVLRHIDKNGYGGNRKAVVTIAAALIGAGADYAVEEGEENRLRETVLRCLLED